MVAVLVLPRASARLVRDEAPAGARIIAVDGGLAHVLAAGALPALVVGDLDSAPPEALAQATRAGVRIEHHPREKRDTDAMLALRHAAGHEEIIFLGLGGGRPDHALANLHALLHAARIARVRAVDADAKYWIATPERAVELTLTPGALVSVLPLTDHAHGVTLEGLTYPLTDATMESGDPYGISNTAQWPRQSVRVAEGALLIIAPRHP